MTQRQKVGLLLGVCGFIIAAVFALVPPLAQDLSYHHFSDPRTWLAVPNFGDVMSNAPFVAAGLYGLWVLSRRPAQPARLPLLVFFIGVILVAPGSAYYHWAPDNATLFWDRLPMTVAFMGLAAAVLVERVDAKVGVCVALPLLLAVGVASAVYWRVSDDLRAYALVQFLPMLAIPAMLWLFPSGSALIGWRAIGGVFVFYGLAKVTEHFDAQVLDLLGGTVSGHTLKHLFAAMGPVAMVMNLRR